MPYEPASQQQIQTFRTQGFLVVQEAVLPSDLSRLSELCNDIIANRKKLAFDWAWQKGTAREDRPFEILQSSPTRLHPEVAEEPFRVWAAEFGTALLGRPCEFWYDQFLGKPPHSSAETPWHQDEAYWGRNLEERGITCWLPLHDVGVDGGCMHFVPGGHLLGILPHAQPPNVQSDLLTCDVGARVQVACPVCVGSVTFHHGKTPHMTKPNDTDKWRRVVSQRFRVVGSKGEGDHYPWKVYVNQFTGERVKPQTR
ncbi:MAG: phytanoyl-CoA dioxygenase family protein [Gammaproteobacteria bacterium]|nr:phytanoyl-CoA dioxygenase family protein [Gammaproteobacteria bacterium]